MSVVSLARYDSRLNWYPSLIRVAVSTSRVHKSEAELSLYIVRIYMSSVKTNLVCQRLSTRCADLLCPLDTIAGKKSIAGLLIANRSLGA
jgi:hypothetical protein